MNEKFLGHNESKPNEIKLKVDAELIVERIVAYSEQQSVKQKEKLKKHYEDLLRKYNNMELTLPIDDEPMKRICQVLTNNGFITQSSCEGRKEKSPQTFLLCEDQQ
jgi:hypothetical protein